MGSLQADVLALKVTVTVYLLKPRNHHRANGRCEGEQLGILQIRNLGWVKAPAVRHLFHRQVAYGATELRV